jgi:AAA+ ATPase superfamily predicted ATPase
MKTMQFYNRKQELDILAKLRQQTVQTARMTVLTGRRRVGKTRLALEFARNHKHLYFFIAKKTERLLCQDFLAEIALSKTSLPCCLNSPKMNNSL